MQLGVFLVLLQDRPLDQALDHVKQLDVDCVEIGCGAYPGSAHADPGKLLQDRPARDALAAAAAARDIKISALSCHGNPVHPRAELAAEHDRTFRDTVRLAAELEVDTVITFSGQPGDRDGGTTPNWVTQIWPPEYGELLDWQWRERVGPYWAEAAAFAKEHGVKVAIELHPGFIAYNTASFRRLRAEAGGAGDNLYVNFDPSHLFWQGMDPLECVDELGAAIGHVHAKDTSLHGRNIRLNGVLDVQPYKRVRDRSWIFRTVGYGHGEEFWRQLVSRLRVAGYDGALSIEHEDALMSIDEGLRRAVTTLKSCLIEEAPPEVSWA